MADYELWHALHDECPIYGCGKCVVIEDIEIPDEVIEACRILGEDVDVFIHKAIVAGMKAEGW